TVLLRDHRVVQHALCGSVALDIDVGFLPNLERPSCARCFLVTKHVARLGGEVFNNELFGTHKMTFPSAPRSRTGWWLRIDTRLNELIVRAAHSAMANVSSPSTARASSRSACDCGVSGSAVVASAMR